MVCLSKLFKGCLPQILFGPLLEYLDSYVKKFMVKNEQFNGDIYLKMTKLKLTLIFSLYFF